MAFVESLRGFVCSICKKCDAATTGRLGQINGGLQQHRSSPAPTVRRMHDQIFQKGSSTTQGGAYHKQQIDHADQRGTFTKNQNPAAFRKIDYLLQTR